MNARTLIEAETPKGALRRAKSAKPVIRIIGILPKLQVDLALYLNRFWNIDFDWPSSNELINSFLKRYWEFIFYAINEGAEDRGEIHYMMPSTDEFNAAMDPPDEDTQEEWSYDDKVVGRWEIIGDRNALGDDDYREDSPPPDPPGFLRQFGG